jgi:hypothetical protein
VCTQDVKILCEIDIEVVFFNLLNENTIFYLIKTKQSCYYLNLFHESIYFRIYVGFTHVGLNVSDYTFLVSRNSRQASVTGELQSQVPVT